MVVSLQFVSFGDSFVTGLWVLGTLIFVKPVLPDHSVIHYLLISVQTSLIRTFIWINNLYYLFQWTSYAQKVYLILFYGLWRPNSSLEGVLLFSRFIRNSSFQIPCLEVLCLHSPGEFLRFHTMFYNLCWQLKPFKMVSMHYY